MIIIDIGFASDQIEVSNFIHLFIYIWVLLTWIQVSSQDPKAIYGYTSKMLRFSYKTYKTV